jgi:(4S)-4-hydroxy-5-phosphonooxypentane-2,3-dione isomerase
MVTYLVQVQVKKEYIDEFIKATEINVRNSRLENGIISFEFFQQNEADDQFVLIEKYRDTQDQLAHRDTGHYQKWRETVEKMMASPRKGVKLISLIP